MRLVSQVDAFLASTQPGPETAREIGKEYREVADFLLATYKEVKDLDPLPRFRGTIEILGQMVRIYTQDFVNYLKEVEDVLEKGKGLVNYNIKVVLGPELSSSFSDAWKRRFRPFH